jgi:hypothetical protein
MLKLISNLQQKFLNVELLGIRHFGKVFLEVIHIELKSLFGLFELLLG